MTTNDNHKTLKTGTLKKTGAPYEITTLTPADIPQILNLQDEVFDSLTADEQNFLLRKDKSFFENHFAHGNIVLGIVSEGKLVAQSVILHPTSAHPKSGMTDMALDAKPEEVTVLQGVIVHPDYRGNKLMTFMVDEWLAVANAEGRKHALAEVTTGNFFSWSVFMKEGLGIHSLGCDKSDGTDLYNMYAEVAPLMEKRLKGDFNNAAAVVKVPLGDIESQKTLTNAGFLGVAFEAANQNIVFQAPKNAAKAPKGPKI
jgi:hypothetical protein